MGDEGLKKLMAELAKACQPYGRQKEVAKELGVSEQILSNWLSGSRVPLLKNLVQDRGFSQKAEEPQKIDALGRPRKRSGPRKIVNKRRAKCVC
jgi:transposase-like protein